MNSHSIIPPKTIINKTSYLFLYSLLKSIFIIDSDNRIKKNKKLDEIIQRIKDNYNIELKREYSKENFENIIKYVKTQNIKSAGEILENILIRLFTSIMLIPQNETRNKYIYYNLQNVYGIKNKVKEKQDKEIEFIQNFILYNKLFPEELKNKEIFFQPYTIIPTDLEYFLTLIYKLKIDSIKNIYEIKEKQFNETSYNLYKYSLKNLNNKEEKNIFQNSIFEFENNLNKIYENYKHPSKNNSSNIMSYFFFTLFVNYQTTNCRLIEYCNNNKNIHKFVNVPYEYNLIGGLMKSYYAILVSSPMRQDDRIQIISIGENDLGELGMYELGKTIIFNTNIKILNYNKNRLFTYYFYYLNKSSTIFENDSIEEINLYNNFLKDDIDNYLCDILKKFKNLKTLNLSNNKLGSGISNFLSRLKLLYRQKKSKLEKLNLNKCYLDTSSLYELCECLKSKYCKLKCLYLNINNINDYTVEPLLNAIKKNNSLKKVYLSRNFIGNSSTDKIGKIISRFHESLEVLYLNQNEIRNNDNLLRITSRTKVVYSKEEDKKTVIIDLDENPVLQNLDLSKNGVNVRNKNQIWLLKNIINDTYLSCLDYSIILKDYEHHEESDGKHYDEYKNEIAILNENLKKIKEQRNIIFEYIDEMKSIQNKYGNIFEQYIENEDLNDVLTETIKDGNIFTIYEDIESILSYELLESIGKKEEDLLDDDNYHLVKSIVKYMLLYKVNGGMINQWLKGINKCLVII
jgi:hypothetical protein